MEKFINQKERMNFSHKGLVTNSSFSKTKLVTIDFDKTTQKYVAVGFKFNVL